MITPRRTYRFSIRLEIFNHFPNLRPEAVALVKAERSGELTGNVWRQLFDVFRSMLGEIQRERIAARKHAAAMPRRSRYYD